MESQAPVLITAPVHLLMSRRPRLLFNQVKAIVFAVVLVCASSNLVNCGPCSVSGLQSVLEHEACDKDIHNAEFQDVSVGDVSTGYLIKSGLAQPSLESICSNSNLLCFPSTLPGYFSENDNRKSNIVKTDFTLDVGSTQANNNLSWSSDYGKFVLSAGRTVSCSSNSRSGSINDLLIQTRSSSEEYASSFRENLHSQEKRGMKLNENSEMIKSGFSDGSQSPHVEISPPVLDWGKKSLYDPSFGFLTVTNTHKDSNLFLYEPFSTSSQFYPCNSSEVLLRPGEVASICFVFLPTWVGVSSAQLILQTSSGGFLIQAKGFAVESPYKVHFLEGPDISTNRRWNRNLSLFNPFDETLSVEELTVWVSGSLGNGSYLTKTICKLEDSENSDKSNVMTIKEWLDVKRNHVGMPLMAMRPINDWEIDPGSTETIIELDFLYNSEENAFGAICVQLLRSSQGKSDTLVIPLETDLNGEPSIQLRDPVSISFETLPRGTGEATGFALLLRNRAPYLLRVIRIGIAGEGSELLRLKYLDSLMLFPGSVTQVAVISYVDPSSEIPDPPSVNLDASLSCSLTVLTNDSNFPQVQFRCKDMVNIRSNYYLYRKYEEQDEKAEYGNAGLGTLQSNVNLSPLLKAMEATKPDELVLGNWKSQGTATGMSVLDHHEIMFPVVQIGTHHYEWITVRNPSQHPVLMQLILNSGEIIDDCKAMDGFPEPSSSSSLILGQYALQTRYGFSIAESALTEAYVHPYETATLGPIVFHPSKRCGWRSSALIRNNLSGVEWLHLQGFGGSFSLGLFEGSKSVQNLEFRFNLPSSLNSSPGNFYQMEETTHTCSKPLLKELYAKNMGDLPLHVRRIDVSGTECGSDGFAVHSCKGFALQPGESTKVLISYRPDFSAVVLQRDLELSLGSGILVIPMKANLPLHMFSLCKKSMFWMRLMKLSFAILLAACFLLLLFFYIPQSISVVSQDYFLKSGKNSIAVVRHVGKTSKVHHSPKKYNKFSASSKMNGLIRSVEEEDPLMLDTASRYLDGRGVASEQEITSQQTKYTVRCQSQTNYLLDNETQTAQESKYVQGESQDGKLTVRVGKEKGRRRRKKRGSVFPGMFEVSSSQSGNSTPSSPLSPVTSFTPKRSCSGTSDADQSIDMKNQCVLMSERQCQKSSLIDPISKAKLLGTRATMKSSGTCSFIIQEKPSPPLKKPGKPVLLQSATFPSRKFAGPNVACPSRLISTSTIAPHARAPGSKLCGKQAVSAEKKASLEHQFEYDIWGDHLFGRQLIDRSKKVYPMTSNVMETHSDSFFVSGPQTLLSNSQIKTVSCSFEEG